MVDRPKTGTCRLCGASIEIKPVGRIPETCSKLCKDRLYRSRNRDKFREYYKKYRENNPEKVRERLKAWREENAEEIAEKKKAHYQENIDHYREYKREYHQKNADRLTEKTLQWQRDNPDKVHIKAQRRRARLREAFVEDVNPFIVLERDNWECHLCGGSIDPSLKSPERMSWSIDHVIPLAKGGTHEYSNCKAAHRVCNSRKGASLDYVPNVDAELLGGANND